MKGWRLHHRERILRGSPGPRLFARLNALADIDNRSARRPGPWPGLRSERERILREAREHGFTQIKERVGDFEVSTVRLPIPHPGPGGVDCMFETMIFGSKVESGQYRYPTCQEAVDGHVAVVKLLLERTTQKIGKLVPELED